MKEVVLAQPRLMGPGVLGASAAIGVYAQIARAPRAGLLPEPAGCEVAYPQRVRPELPARLLTDGCLAAFAQSAGLRLVTLDCDFSRFGALDRLELA